MPGLKTEEKGVKVTAEQKAVLNWPECWRKIHRVCLRHKTWALKSKRGRNSHWLEGRSSVSEGDGL